MTQPLHVVPNICSSTVRKLNKGRLLAGFTRLVDQDRRNTAALIAYIAEIDRRKLYLEHAYPSMFAFCTKRFGMSEAVAMRRIRAGRATSRFPSILGMLARGEIHLTGVHLLSSHLTEENHAEVLRRARRRSTREIEELIAEITPKPDAPSSIRALPSTKGGTSSSSVATSSQRPGGGPTQRGFGPGGLRNEPLPRPVPIAPRRYKLQVTIDQEARDNLEELQALLSHQIPDGDPAKILARALDVLLAETKKRRMAAADRPRRPSKKAKKKTRVIPAHVRRQVFKRDRGRCTFVDPTGRRCGSTWQIELHHRIPYARGGTHEPSNLELRCRAHNQHEAEVEYGVQFMDARRRKRSRAGPT